MIIDELRQYYSLKLLLKISNFPRSSFYYHQKSLTRPDKYYEHKQMISDLFHSHKGRYGYRRITVALRNTGKQINHKTVQRLMGELNLNCRIRCKKFRTYKGTLGEIAENHLNRNFSAVKPNYKWVTDITEFKVSGRKLYLSPVLDLYNSEIISFHMSERPNLDLVDNMLSEALKALNPGEHPILHSDQGWQYQMPHYQEKLKKQGITQSMSRKGNCLDNAVIENFFGILKSECFYTKKFTDINQLKYEVEEFIHYYNNERIKLKLNGLSPIQYRTQTMLTT